MLIRPSDIAAPAIKNMFGGLLWVGLFLWAPWWYIIATLGFMGATILTDKRK